jgi:hypothetical protein
VSRATWTSATSEVAYENAAWTDIELAVANAESGAGPGTQPMK